MTTFIGKYEAKADVKGRIFIPAAYRKILPNDEKERVVVRKDTENDCMIVYPESIWNSMMQDLNDKLDIWNPDDQMLLMQFVSDAEWLDIDSQGRVLLSKKLLNAIGLEDGNVLFVGMNNRFAIWSKARYEESMKPRADFARLLKERMMGKSTPISEEEK